MANPRFIKKRRISMAEEKDAGTKFIKNRADFHPALDALNKQNREPSGAVVSGTSASESPRATLEQLSTESLAERARALAIDGREDMSRAQLIAAILQWGEGKSADDGLQ